MASDAIGIYQDALKAVEEAEREAERVVGYIRDAAGKLGDWKGVVVANTGVGFPIGRTRSINADQWPTAMQLAEALAAYHSSISGARNAYGAIPSDRRHGIQPPPASS